MILLKANLRLEICMVKELNVFCCVAIEDTDSDLLIPQAACSKEVGNSDGTSSSPFGCFA